MSPLPHPPGWSRSHGALNLAGWQWIFLIGGIPAIRLGAVCFTTVTDRPANARWLTPEQRTWLTSTLAAEEAERTTTAPPAHRSRRSMLVP